MAIGLLFAVLTSAPSVWAQSRAAAASELRLRSRSGPVSLSDFKGKVLLVYFGYATCADVCPMALSLMAQGLKGLGPDDYDRAAGLFITVDPERDSAEVVSNYAGAFDKRITGVTGRIQDIAVVAATLGATFKKVPAKGVMRYCMDHSSATYLIDPAGRLAQILPHGSSPAIIVSAVRRHIRRSR